MELKKTLSFWDVFAIALGQVIGSGIMVLIGIGIEFTAYAIPFAFVLSATLSIIKQLPVAFMGSAKIRSFPSSMDRSKKDFSKSSMYSMSRSSLVSSRFIHSFHWSQKDATI